jgi:hypothetical protein
MRMRTRTHTRQITDDQPKTYWIEIVELIDDRPTGKLRRRHRRLPNLHVGITTVEPGPELDRRWERRRRKTPGCYAAIRYDLMDGRAFDSKTTAAKRRVRVSRSLMNRGFTVNGDLTCWSTYVIELDHSHLPDCAGWFYVGMSSKPASQRVWEHMTGARNKRGPLFSRDAHNHFVRWRPDIGRPHIHFSREAALQAEAQLRIVLEDRGYRVTGGTERYQDLREGRSEPRNPTSEGESE